MKMKYKRYPLTYEKVFTSEGCLKTFTPEKLETDYPGGKKEYFEKFRSFFYDFDRFFFKNMVEYYWLQRRFTYMGFRKVTHSRVFIRADAAYSTFIKHTLGFNYQLFTSTFVFSKIVTYFNNFFGDIDNSNPFEDPKFYEFPFKNIGLAHLTLVYQMDERMDLLKEAEEGKMSYYEFLDFVINYIYCVNDEKGQQIFNLYRPLNNSGSFYIQNLFRKGKGTSLGMGKSNTGKEKIMRRKPYEYKKYEIKTSDIRKHTIQQIPPEHGATVDVVKGVKDNPGS